MGLKKYPAALSILLRQTPGLKIRSTFRSAAGGMVIAPATAAAAAPPVAAAAHRQGRVAKHFGEI